MPNEVGGDGGGGGAIVRFHLLSKSCSILEMQVKVNRTCGAVVVIGNKYTLTVQSVIEQQ